MIELKYIANILLLIIGLIFITGGANRLSRFIGVIPYTAGLLNIVLLYVS